MKTFIVFLSFLLLTAFQVWSQQDSGRLSGAWIFEDNGQTSVAIIADGYFSVAKYEGDRFINIYGGTYQFDSNWLKQVIEFNASDPAAVGTVVEHGLEVGDGELIVGDQAWKRVSEERDELNGAWLITGRKRDGQMSRTTPGARKTMKILNGSRFQWIAYNTETGEFFGTGGGTYEIRDGQYIETIEFFSRDPSRVGAKLQFDYEIKEGEWHHSGKSSSGAPLYEIWTKRKQLED